MAKTQKKKDSSEAISISKIYETIKAREFLQELWWDLISDIPNKPSYQRIKEMVKAVINDTMDEFSVEAPSDAEQVKRRTMLTEISIMTYTVDTVMSEVLFKKLQYEFPRLIQNMIADLKRENQIAANTLIDTSGTMLGNTPKVAGKMNNNDANVFRTEQQITRNVLSSKQKSPLKTVANGEGMDHSPVRKRGRPRKQRSEHSVAQAKDSTHSVHPIRKRGRPPLNSTRRSNSSDYAVKDDKQTSEVSNQSPVSIKSEEDEDVVRDSDEESDVSVGGISDTISSVHTSELSSFEDTISICSGDENGRKRRTVPLKLANDMYLHGKLSEIYEIGKKLDKPKMHAALTDKSTRQKNSPSIDSSPSARKPPQRIRKPNSKYNPDTMYCEVKDYSSPQASLIALSPQKDTTSIESPQKKRRISHSNEKSENSTHVNSSPVIQPTEVDSINKHSPTTKNSAIVSNRTPKGSPATRNTSLMNHLTPVKSSTKRYSPSDLYKPRSAIKNSAGSRGSPATSPFSN